MIKNIAIAILVVTLGVTSYTSFEKEDLFGNVESEVVVNEVFEEYHPLIVTAFDNAEKEFIKDIVIDEVEKMDPDPKKCICKGTGLLPTDGSVVSYCKYHGNKGSIGKVSEEPVNTLETVTVNSKPLKSFVRKDRPKNETNKTSYQVIMFTAKWCGPCQYFKAGPLNDLKNTVDDLEISENSTADFRIIDIDDPRFKSYYQSMRAGIRTIPLFVEIKDNKIISRESGTRGKDLQYLMQKYDLEEKR